MTFERAIYFLLNQEFLLGTSPSTQIISFNTYLLQLLKHPFIIFYPSVFAFIFNLLALQLLLWVVIRFFYLCDSLRKRFHLKGGLILRLFLFLFNLNLFCIFNIFLHIRILFRLSLFSTSFLANFRSRINIS